MIKASCRITSIMGTTFNSILPDIVENRLLLLETKFNVKRGHCYIKPA